MATEPTRSSEMPAFPPSSALPLNEFPMVRTFSIAVGIVLCLFVLYDLAEPVWFSELDMQSIHVLHQLRGLGAAVAALAYVGWSILKWSQRLLDQAGLTDAGVRTIRQTREQRDVLFARWFILLRWIAVLVATILILVTVLVARVLPGSVLSPLLTTVALLAGVNVAYLLLLRIDRVAHTLLPVQAYVDLTAFVILLHYSGSLENPLCPLMLFHVIIVGMILPRRHCFAIAAFGGALFAGLASVELTELVPHYTLTIFPHMEHDGELVHASKSSLFVISQVFSQFALMFLTAFFVTRVVERLRRDEVELERYAGQVDTERRLLEQALEITQTGLSVFDRDLNALWQNVQWLTWFGVASDTSDLYEQMRGPDSDIARTIRDGHVREAQISLVTTAGSGVREDDGQRTFQTTTAALMDDQENVTRVVQLARDITEDRRTQAGLVQAGKMAAVGQMAGEIAHEVNNPIAIIAAKARLLLRNHKADLTDTVSEELRKITEMADRVARIVQGILSYSRPSAGLRERIDIKTPVINAIELTDQRARLANVTIETDLPDEPLTVMGNANELEQVFVNLLINSLDAMQGGGRIAVSAGASDETRDGEPMYRIVVEDSGTGVFPEIQSHIFEPFFSTKAEGDGTGLGLSICLGLVQSHGGSIELTSVPGEGTRVLVYLPMDIPVNAEA